MQLHQFQLVPAIHYGPGAARRAGEVVRGLGAKRVLLVSDAGVFAAGVAEPVVDALAAEGVEVVEFTDLRSNPSDAEVALAVERYRGWGCEGVVGVGGGSALDVAKSVVTVVAGGGCILDYERGARPVPTTRPPLVLVPTTSGTGSEAVSGAIITDTLRMAKVLIVAAPADVSLCDPLLCVTLPPELTAACGIDALAHAIGAYVSSERQPLADAMALHAMALIASNLPRAIEDGSDVGARHEMVVGSLTAGISMKGGGAVDHAFAHAVNILFDVHHGVGVAQFLVAAMNFNAPSLPHRFADIARALGVRDLDDDPVRTGRRGIEVVGALIDAAPIPTLADLCIGREHVDDIVEKVMEDDFHLGLNPVSLGEADARRITLGLLAEDVAWAS